MNVILILCFHGPNFSCILQMIDIFPVALLTIIKLAETAKQDRILHSFFNLRCGLALKLLAELIQEEGEVFG